MLKKIVLVSVMFLVMSVPARAFEICISDGIEKLYITIQPKGLLTGYSKFFGKTVGTAIGSYKRISDMEVMVGGNINNDCGSGLIPGSFNAIINVKTLTGIANGFLFMCDDGKVMPYTFTVSPCEDESASKRQNWGRIEDYQ